jgi:hypothetical protein
MSVAKTIFTEPKAQGWRALLVFRDNTEGLLFVGSSVLQVREGYRTSWFELLDDEERSRAKEIRLQKWQGTPDRGRWTTDSVLSIPAPQTAQVAV